MREPLFSEFAPVSTQEWMDAIIKDLKGADYNKKLVWKTDEGFPVNPLYRAEDLNGLEFLNTEPGNFPYVRGGKTDNNNWEIRQDFSMEDLEQCNALAREAAQKGAESVGVCCRNVASANDFDKLLKGIDVSRTGIHLLCSRNYSQTLDCFVEYIAKIKVPASSVYGSIDFDPLAYALTHGEFYGGDFGKNMDECAALFKKFSGVLPKFKLLSVNAGLLHNAGGFNVHELAFGLNWACEYFAALTDRGLDIDGICSRTVLKLGIGSDYFMQIAKIRAARLLWSYMVKGFKPADMESARVFIHAESSKWNQTVYDPYVNLLRSTTETMSAAIGGADSIHVNEFSTAYKDADGFAARLARNQQIILKEESFFNRIIDPAAGSYYIENITAFLAQASWKLFLETEEKGGFAACVKAGSVQELLESCDVKRNEDLAKRKTVLTGVNQFPNLNEKCEDCRSTDLPVRENRNTDLPVREKNPNRFPSIRPYRGAEEFESLRMQTEEYAAKNNGRKPKVFLLTYGNLAMRKARAGFATNFFGCLGYEIIDNPGFETAAAGADAALKSGAEICVLCSSDEEYPDLAAAVCPVLKGKTCLVYAGAPAEEEPFRALGIEYFIHVRSNVLQTLRDFQKKLGL